MIFSKVALNIKNAIPTSEMLQLICSSIKTAMKNLTDLKVGDFVAAQIDCWKGFRKKTIKKITPTYIILEGHSSTKFKKDTGFATDGDKNTECRDKFITVITEEIQENWDRVDLLSQLDSVLKSEDLPVEKLKEAVVILIKESNMREFEYRNIILNEILIYWHKGKFSSKALKQALNSLTEQP